MKKGTAAFLILGTLLLYSIPHVCSPQSLPPFRTFASRPQGNVRDGDSSILQDREGSSGSGPSPGWPGTMGTALFFTLRSQSRTLPGRSRPRSFTRRSRTAGQYMDRDRRPRTFQVRQAKRSLRAIPARSADPASLSGNTVLAVQEDKTGNLWVGTRPTDSIDSIREQESSAEFRLDTDAGAVWDLLVDQQGFLG